MPEWTGPFIFLKIGSSSGLFKTKEVVSVRQCLKKIILPIFRLRGSCCARNVIQQLRIFRTSRSFRTVDTCNGNQSRDHCIHRSELLYERLPRNYPISDIPALLVRRKLLRAVGKVLGPVSSSISKPKTVPRWRWYQRDLLRHLCKIRWAICRRREVK